MVLAILRYFKESPGYFKVFQGVSGYLRCWAGDPRVECPSGDWWMVGSSGKQGKAQPSTQYFCPTISKLVFSYFSIFWDFCTGTVPELKSYNIDEIKLLKTQMTNALQHFKFNRHSYWLQFLQMSYCEGTILFAVTILLTGQYFLLWRHNTLCLTILFAKQYF